MTKSLLKVQFQALFSSMMNSNSQKNRGPIFKVLIGILSVYVVGCLLFAVGFMFYPLAQAFPSVGVAWLYWSFAAVLCLFASFIFTVFTANSQLFEAKDNELLMSMPLRPGQILFCRMFSLYLIELMFTVLIMLPVVAFYFYVTSFSAAMLIPILLGTFLIPMLALSLATAVGWLLGLISSRLKRKALISTLLMLIFFGGFMYVYMNIFNYINQLAASGLAIAEIFRKVLSFAYHFGIAVEETNLLSLLYFVLWCIVPVVVVYLIIQKNFIKIATTNRGSVKTKYVERELQVTGIRAALLKKEFANFTSLPLYMFNDAIGLLMMLVYAGAVLIKGKELIATIVSQVAMDFGAGPMPSEVTGFLAMMAAALMLFCVITNITASASISLEGKNFWILRTSPVSFGDVMYAKVGMNIFIALPFILIAAVATLIVVPMNFAQACALFVLPISFQILVALFGFAANLWFPKLDFVNPVQVIKQGASALITVFGGMAFLAIPVVLYATVFINADPTVFLYAVSAGALLLSAVLYFYLTHAGKKIYESIHV